MSSKRKDFTQIAFDVVQRATGEVVVPALSKKQESGRKGGVKGGLARATKLTPEQRTDIAQRAARSRWSKSPAIAPIANESAPSRKKAKVAL